MHAPPVAVGGLAGGPVSAAHVLLLTLDALGLGHPGMELVPDLHHLLDRLVHVRAGLGQVEEDELDPPLLPQVELQALGLERVAGDAGRVEHVDPPEWHGILLGGVEQRQKAGEVVARGR